MRVLLLTCSVLLVLGCNDAIPKPTGTPRSPTETRRRVPDATYVAKSPLEPLLMAQKPNSAISVTEVMKRKAGETVVVTGQLPPVKVQPFNAAVAAFVMLAPESLEREEVKEEFDCDDAAT